MSSRRAGFTLVELMVALVILALLSSVVTVSVRTFLLKSKQNIARIELGKLVQALDTFYATFDRYPSNEEGIAILSAKSEAFPEGLINVVPTDPWGTPYEYRSPGLEGPYDLLSLGADKREGGTGGDKDISASDLNRKNP